MAKWGRFLLFSFLLILFSNFSIASDFSDDGIWQRISEKSIQQISGKSVSAKTYLTFRLNKEILQNILKQAPMEFSAGAKSTNVIVSLPVPDGRYLRFRIEESPIMESGLAAQFPGIKTYIAQGMDDATMTARLGWTSGGFHAVGLTVERAFFVSPYQHGDVENYVSNWGDDDPQTFECFTAAKVKAENRQTNLSPLTGPTLRTYSAAIAATGEYTAKFPPGTKDSALNNGIIPTLNGLNAIFEREFTLRLVLVNDEMNIIYTNAGTDPYTGGDVFAMLQENQTNVDAVIGTANYDFGHVFSGAGGGGVAYLGVPCTAGWKARGASGTTNPTGNGFILLVAHEAGHQFDANHSFNGTTGNCGPNRSGFTAWEPGSGSTIQSYAGICGAENLAGGKVPYYHVGSYDEVNNYISFTTCDTETATGNGTPTVNAGSDYTIPQSTPFTLTGTASDPDGDSLTYNWEELDTGTASPPNTDDGSRPIFRSFVPATSLSRTFPKLSDILNNTNTLGEALPTTDRTLDFRFTVRDNRAGGGSVTHDSMVITVENGAGPFLVTSPNTNITWTGGGNENVQWNVAGTAAAPINVSNVRILLSTDGGQTFPTVLLASTPNDGNQNVSVPFVATTMARIKVEAVGNVFFDISNTNFTITATGCAPITVNPTTLPNGVIGTAYSQTITATGGTGPYTFAVTNGSLPTSLNLATNGALTGTPSQTGNFTFTVTATDSADCTGSRSYTIGITNVTCLFCDNFNDGVLSTGWTYLKLDWVESGGFLSGTPAGRKAIVVATPIFAGCSNCTVEAEMRSAGGPQGLVWLLAWYIDKKNTLELMMNEKGDKWLLKQKVNGKTAKKAKGLSTIDPDTTYDVRITFDGNQFQVYINNTLLITMPKKNGSNPNGTVGFQSKNTTGSFDSVTVN
jgi:hypothetical protein